MVVPPGKPTPPKPSNSDSEDDDTTIELDDDKTIELTQTDDKEDGNPIGLFLETSGHLCNSTSEDYPLLHHGLCGARMQNIQRSFNSEHGSLAFVLRNLKDYMDAAVDDVGTLMGTMEIIKSDKVEYHTALAKIGYQLMALGLWCTLHGPYTHTHTMDSLESLVDGAKGTPRKHMAKWIWALSVGMECSDLSSYAGYNILNIEDEWQPVTATAAAAAPASPDAKMSPEEMQRYLHGLEGGNKKRKL